MRSFYVRVTIFILGYMLAWSTCSPLFVKRADGLSLAERVDPEITELHSKRSLEIRDWFGEKGGESAEARTLGKRARFWESGDEEEIEKRGRFWAEVPDTVEERTVPDPGLSAPIPTSQIDNTRREVAAALEQRAQLWNLSN